MSIFNSNSGPIPYEKLSIERMGWYCTLLFALSILISPSIVLITFFFMVALALANFRRFWPIIRSDPMFWLFLLFLACASLSTALAKNTQSAKNIDHLEAIWRFSGHFFFVIPAFWLKSDMKRMWWMIGLGCLSLVAGLILCVDWAFWSEALQGQRVPLTQYGLITMGLFASIGLLGVLLVGPRWLAHKGSHWNWVSRILLALLLAAFFFQMVLISQSRNVWIGLLLIYPPLLIARYAYLFKTWPAQKSYKLIAVPALLIALALLMLSLHSYDSIAIRLSVDHEDFKRLARLETQGYNQDGFGVRPLLNIYGFEKWKERPIFGWGPGANLKSFNHTHLHNAYLEILVRFGLIGFIIMIIYAFLLFRAILWARSHNRMPQDFWLFMIGVYALTALFCLTDFRLTNLYFRFFWSMIASLGYTSYLYRHQSIGARNSANSDHRY